MINNSSTAQATDLGMCPGGGKFVGSVKFIIRDKDGNIVDEGGVTNNIVLGIRKPIIKLLAGWALEPGQHPFVQQLALGSGDTAPTVLDNGLVAEIEGSRKLAATAPTISEDGLTATFAFLYNEVDDAVDGKDIKEMGLFTVQGDMIARTTIGLWRKVTGMYFEVYWTIGYNG